LINSG